MALSAAYTSGQVLTAANMNSMPFSMPTTTAGGTSSIGYITGLAAQTVNAGVTADVTSSSMTFTGISGRLYEYMALGQCTSSSASGVCTFAVTDGSNTILQRAYINMTNAAGSGSFAIRYLFTSTSSTTIKLRLTSDTGNTTIYGAASLGAITLRDIGPTS